MGSNNIFIMHSESKFSFRNLQPINYLTQFNRMVEHTKRHPGESSARSDLNLVPLSKFPISKYYEDMEGIFQNLVRKKQEHGSPLRSREMIEEERFMEKHNEFMRKVLTKFIIHNQDRMGMYEKEKKSIKNNERAKNHFRTMSEPKSLKKLEPRPLQLPQISNLKASPAVGTTENNSPITLKDFKTHPQIVNLQLKQARKQSTFAQKIQQQISKFDKQMQIQAKQIREYRFWKEAEVAEVKAVKKQKKVEKSDGIEFEFSLKNFAST